MNFGFSRGGVARLLTHATPLFFILCQSGCDPEGYPTSFKYPPRTEVIVVEASSEETYYPDQPGRLDITAGGKAKVVDPAKLSAEDRGKIAAAVEECFGTPANPRVKIELAATDEDKEEKDAYARKAIDELQLGDAAFLAEGSKLFRRHCMHCHGVSGNGRGPTGPWLNPHPRDYQKGKFKFVSTSGRKKVNIAGSSRELSFDSTPSRADLLRVLKHGIDYTSMPSFALLSDQELDQLISYVMHLSLRGQAEEDAIISVVKGGETLEDGAVQKVAFTALTKWKVANEPDSVEEPTVPMPSEPTPESIRNGYKLFVGGACIGCHKDFGRQTTFRFDIWGTMVQPRDLTSGQYHGGRRPIDLFWRVKLGINPATMPQAARVEPPNDKKSDPAEVRRANEQTDRNVWDIIAFVQAVPYPNMLPDDVRKEIYPTLTAKKE